MASSNREWRPIREWEDEIWKILGSNQSTHVSSRGWGEEEIPRKWVLDGGTIDMNHENVISGNFF